MSDTPTLEDLIAHRLRYEGWPCDYHEAEDECAECTLAERRDRAEAK